MTLGKLNIWGLVAGAIMLLAPNAGMAEYNAEDITAMSAETMWAKIRGVNVNESEKEMIICGLDVCSKDKQRCVVKTSIRSDGVTKIAKGAQAVGTVMAASGHTSVATSFIIVGRVIEEKFGNGTVTTYEYKCVNKSAKLEDGWNEATGGNWVREQHVRKGDWFPKDKEEGMCSDGSDGGLYCISAKGGVATVSYNSGKTAFKGCEVLPVKLYNARRCFFCPLFSVMYKVAGEMTSISFKALASAFAVVLMLGWALWVAMQTLTQVSSITKQDAPKFLTGLIKQSYKVMIAFLLLQYSGQIFHYAIVPVLDAGISFGDALLNERYKAISVDQSKTKTEQMEERNPGISARASMLTNTEYYTTALYIKLDNFIVNVQRNLAFMQSVGSSLICIGGHGMVNLFSSLKFGQGFIIVIQGVLMAAFSFLMTLAFAFYLLDAVVQLGIAGALMPFLIASWPFKITSKYTKIGWNMVLNSTFVFMFAGMVVAVDLGLIDSAINYTASEQTNVISDDGSCAGDKCEVNMGGLYGLAQAINSQDESSLISYTDISGTGFLILLFCCIFALVFMGKVEKIAGKFAGGALKPTAPSIATMAGSAAKSFALKSTQATREAIGDKIKDTNKALWGKARSGVASIFKGKKNSGAAPAAPSALSPSPSSGSASAAPTRSASGASEGGSEAEAKNSKRPATLNEGNAETAQNRQKPNGGRPENAAQKAKPAQTAKNDKPTVQANAGAAGKAQQGLIHPSKGNKGASVEQARKAGPRTLKAQTVKNSSRKGRGNRYKKQKKNRNRRR